MSTMPAKLPRRVSLIAFGMENKKMVKALETGLDGNWWHIDCNRALEKQECDPLKDGTWPQIQEAVLSIDGFDEFLIKQLKKIIEDPYRDANTYSSSLGLHRRGAFA